MSSTDLMFLKKSGVDIGDYTLFIDGRLVIRTNNRVSISITSDYEPSFFVFKAVEGGSPVRDFSGGIANYVANLMDNTTMFGVDFKDWFSPSLLETTRSRRITTNPSMKLMFYETLPYHILKRRFTDPSMKGTMIDGGEGKALDSIQLNMIQNEFRARGFETYDQMFESRMMRKIADYRGLATIPRMYTLAYAHLDGLYNPLMDDPEIREDFLKSPLGSAIGPKINVTNRGTSYAFMSHYEVSRVINVGGVNPRILHFKYSMILRMLAAKYVSGLRPSMYPYKGQRVYLLRDDIPGVNLRVLTEEQYRDVPEEYKDPELGYFSTFDSLNFFFLSQRSFFRKFNMKDRDVSDTVLIDMVADIVI